MIVSLKKRIAMMNVMKMISSCLLLIMIETVDSLTVLLNVYYCNRKSILSPS
jgi:hypothetical protein